jgi:hypothetical protein
MPETRLFKAIRCWKLISKRPTGRPKTRREEEVIQKLKVPNWRTLVRDRRRWKELVEKVEKEVVEPEEEEEEEEVYI